MKAAWNIKAVISLADSLDSVVKPDPLFFLFFFSDEASIWHYVKNWLIKSFIVVKPNSQLFGPHPAKEH